MSATEPQTLMRWIISSSLRFRHLVAAAAVAMMALGITVVPRMHVDVFPEFAPPRVVIQTACVGLSTSDVEQLVTVPIETALNGIQGLDDLRSKSVPQLSSIEVLFKQGTDQLQARQLVQERLATVAPTLPTWAAPPVMLAPVSATGRAMQIGMTSKTRSLIDMSMTAYWTIRARLLRVPGVANVAIWNERLHLMAVQVQPPRMRAAGVSLNQVMQTTADAVDSGLLRFSTGAVIGTGGAIETPNQRISVRNVLPVVTPADLAETPVTKRNGRTVRLGDVATVGQRHQPLIGSAIIDGGPGVLLVVEKLPWANSLRMTAGVEQALKELQPGLPGIRFDTKVFQQADFVKLAITNLTHALVLGFILVVVIIALFLFEWRMALICLLTIPLSLVATILVLYWRGATINTMTLAGLVIALGVLVDDAIIGVENITRRLREERLAGGTESAASVILRACLEVRSPIVYATFIIVAALIPVFLLTGLIGSFFQPLALSYTLAIVASMGVALTVSPALALTLLRGVPIERRSSPLVAWLQKVYSAGLSRVIRRPVAAYLTFALVTLAGVAVYPHLGQSLFPGFKERDFLIHWVSPPGTSTAEMERSTTKISNELLATPGVRSTGAHIGQALLGEEVAGVNLGEIWVSLAPDADYTRTLDRIHSVTNGYPGLFREVQTYLDERIEEVLTGGKEPVIVRTYGDNLAALRVTSDKILALVQTVPGVVDAHRDISSDVPQMNVTVNLARAERYGLKPGDVRRDAATLVAGEEVGDIFRAGKAYDTVVWSPASARHSVSDVENLPIGVPSGGQVRLGAVANVSLQPNPNAIERQGDSRYLDVGAAVSGRDLGAVVNDINKKLAAVHLDRGYHVELLGEYRERQAAQGRLLQSSLIAGVAILLLLQASFRRWRLAALAFLSLPMALVGGVLAAWVGGGIISLGSLVGFFTVFGIAARNGILLINHWQHLEEQEGMSFGPALVLRGARERLSPILMTSLATGLALVPLVVLGNRPGHEIELPLAVVVLGGLVTSTLLNLVILPSLYLRWGRGRRQHAEGTT
ncbi:MAG TPA: efflux RND transporter permease subunit [Streptosporangiaceae bacterium]|jgi:CzcA family heavy metal efflux pump|nr:efflux RND transporter permease subunit [Streptosporangiaceae bacterium]